MNTLLMEILRAFTSKVAKNLLDADISNLYNKNIIINYDAKLYNFAFIDALKNKCEKEQSHLFINFPEAKFSEMGYEVEFDCTDRNLDATTILSKPERHGFKTPVIEIEYKKLSGFADVGEELPNAYRETRVLVEPIIESGSITWLFAAEKVGKTWLGLSIAYAAAKGHRPIGAWKVESPCKVLYIDGEMPAHKLTGMIKKIMNGYEDNGERPFVFYSFFEEDLDYDSILDEEWQKKGISKNIKQLQYVTVQRP